MSLRIAKTKLRQELGESKNLMMDPWDDCIFDILLVDNDIFTVYIYIYMINVGKCIGKYSIYGSFGYVNS